jgi:hypothetical protein
MLEKLDWWPKKDNHPLAEALAALGFGYLTYREELENHSTSGSRLNTT